MKKKLLLVLMVMVCVLSVTGCKKKSNNETNESKNEEIKIVDNKDKGYVTTFKTINNKFVQSNPKYNHVDNTDLGIFITFEYIESSKEAYDYSKTHNFLGQEYPEGEVKEYKWNNYEGYIYGIGEAEMYFRVLLEDNEQNSVVLSGYVGPKDQKTNLSKLYENSEFQEFLNSIEFKKETK